MSLLTNEFKKRIQNKIVELELRTSVEFVPVITDRSSDYKLWRMFFFLLVFSFSLTLLVLEFPAYGGLEKVISSLGIALILFLATFLKPFLSTLLPAHAKFRAVEDRAQSVFLEQEIFLTEQRTGILIFISDFERAVLILADRGFAGKIDSREWKDLGAVLAQDFSKKSAGDTFLIALEKLALRLSADFPPARNNLNEISDNVREV